MTISSVLPSQVYRSRALALSVYFKQSELGMNKYEILSRASAFLLNVDPATPLSADDKDDDSSPYGHLSNRKRRIQTHELKTDPVDRGYLKTRAGGPQGRNMTELGWLEFCPVEFRPAVHVVAAAHVLAPFREPWRSMYYGEQGAWLSKVQPENCKYELEVYDTSVKENQKKIGVSNCLAKFALNPYPIHHPDNLDISLIHLKDEDRFLKEIERLGVESLHLRDASAEPFTPNEPIRFEGFEVALPDGTDKGNILAETLDWDEEENDDIFSSTVKNTNDDERIFIPYTASGELIYVSPERLFAKTDSPLPDGLCGGPAIDQNDKVTGVVEGIVPLSHENKRLAGAAAFISSGAMKSFVDMAEMRMLEQIVPSELYERISKLKSGDIPNKNHPNGMEFSIPSAKGNMTGKGDMSSEMDREQDQIMQVLSKHMSPAELDNLTNEIQMQSHEVINMLKNGEVTDIMEAVNIVQQKYEKQDMDDDETKGATSNTPTKIPRKNTKTKGSTGIGITRESLK